MDRTDTFENESFFSDNALFTNCDIWRDAAEIYKYYSQAIPESRLRYKDQSEFFSELLALEAAGYDEPVLYLLAPHMFCLEPNKCLQFSVHLLYDSLPSLTAVNAERRVRKIDQEFPLLSAENTVSLETVKKIHAHRKQFFDKSPELQKMNRVFKRRLQDALRYYKKQQLLPETYDDISHLLDPDAANQILPLIVPLISVTDSGLSSIFGKRVIRDETWLDAIELTLYESTSNIANFHMNPELHINEELLMDIYGVVIANGILLHTLRQFQNPECYRALYEKTTGDNVYKEELQAARWENSKLMTLTKAYEEQIKSLKFKVSQLQKQVGNTTVRDNSAALVHDHNIAIREKDLEIEQLLAYNKALEEKLASQEEAEFQKAQAADASPWKDISLPELNVVFVGGHYNMVKKLKERFPHWYFLTDDSNESLPANISALFNWSNHLSHKLWWRICRDRPATKPLYVTATNIDLLTEQMQYEYWRTLP